MSIEEIKQRFGRTLKSYVGTGMSREECDNFVSNVLESLQKENESLKEDLDLVSNVLSDKVKENTKLSQELKQKEERIKELEKPILIQGEPFRYELIDGKRVKKD